MPKSYSADLRRHVIEAVETGASRREAAESFGIDASSAVRWLQCWNETGRCAPKPRGGQRPRGWISPRGTPSADTAAFLVEAGYLWQGDVFDDERPYLQVLDAGSLVAIPLTMEINDLPHAMRFGRSPAQYVELFEEALEHLLKAEGEAVMIDVTAHAHVYGRPTSAWAFEAIAITVGARDDVWLATKGEIAAYVRQALG